MRLPIYSGSSSAGGVRVGQGRADLCAVVLRQPCFQPLPHAFERCALFLQVLTQRNAAAHLLDCGA